MSFAKDTAYRQKFIENLPTKTAVALLIDFNFYAEAREILANECTYKARVAICNSLNTHGKAVYLCGEDTGAGYFETPPYRDTE